MKMEGIEMNLTEMTNDQIRGMVMLIEQITKSNLANNIDQPISPEMIAVMAEAEKKRIKIGGIINVKTIKNRFIKNF